LAWSIHYYSRTVQAEILEMPAGVLARYLRYVDRMEEFGPDLGMPPKELEIARRRMREVVDAHS